MKPFTILLLLGATPDWLKLTRTERSAFFAQTIVPILGQCSAELEVRFYDSEYFHSRISDFIIIETHHLEPYQLFIEMVRDTKVYSEPYFQVQEIIVGQENAFRHFDELLNEPI